MAAMPARPGRPDVLRSMNDNAALNLLISSGPLTRAQIGRATGLSGPTVSQVISRLLMTGVIGEAGLVASRRGPEAVSYRVRTEAKLGVALQMLPGSAIACVVDASGQAQPVADVRLPRDRTAASDVAAAVEAACRASKLPSAGIVAVSIGVPGAVSPDSDHLNFVGPLPGWPRREVRSQVEAGLHLKVLMDNDANLAAIAEHEARQDEEDFALLWQGEGLRVASVVDGLVQRGASGGAGEIGYLALPGLAGTGAKPVTLQDQAGSPAVIRIVRSFVKSVRTYEVALVALKSSPQRAAILAELASNTAQALIPALAVLDPARVVLGGPTGAAGGAEYARLVQTYLQRSTRWRVPVTQTVVPDNPVLRGATLTLAAYLTELLLASATNNRPGVGAEHQGPVASDEARKGENNDRFIIAA